MNYYIGDRVVIIADKDKPEAIIAEVVRNEGEFEYATVKSAWFYASDLQLISRADDESLAELDLAMESEYEVDESDEDDLDAVGLSAPLCQPAQAKRVIIYDEEGECV